MLELAESEPCFKLWLAAQSASTKPQGTAARKNGRVSGRIPRPSELAGGASGSTRVAHRTTCATTLEQGASRDHIVNHPPSSEASAASRQVSHYREWRGSKCRVR